MNESFQHIFQNWNKYCLPVFYSKVTLKEKGNDNYLLKYVPISYYRTSEYLVQPPIKPLTKIIAIV